MKLPPGLKSKMGTRLRSVNPPKSGALRVAREMAIEDSWWLWQGGAGSRMSANQKLRPSTSGGSGISVASGNASLRPGTAHD